MRPVGIKSQMKLSVKSAFFSYWNDLSLISSEQMCFSEESYGKQVTVRFETTKFTDIKKKKKKKSQSLSLTIDYNYVYCLMYD